MTLLTSIHDAPSLELIGGSRDRALTQLEQAYLDFMLPRLDRLVEEGTVISSLVEDHSRNVVALRRHGSRITTLTTAIIEWDTHNAVPARFLASHAMMVAAADELQTLIREAENAFMQFDFGGVAELIPRFDTAIETVRTARDSLRNPPPSPTVA